MDQYKEIPEWVSSDERRKLEIFNDTGLFDKNQLALFKALIEYAEKYHTSYLPMQGIYKYIYEYGLRENNNSLKTEEGILAILKQVYAALYRKRYCQVDSQDNKIVALILQDPKLLSKDQVDQILAKLKKDYNNADTDLGKPFPSADYLPKAGLSGKILNIIAIHDLDQQKIKEMEALGPITKILIPNNLDIVVPSDELSKLYRRALEKMKAYLVRYKDFTSLIILKLKQRYTNLNNTSSAEDLVNNERSPQFWVSLATEILNNLQNNEKDRTITQSATLVKMMGILQGEQVQRKSHNDKTIEVLLRILEKYPVSLSKNQILQLRDKHSFLKLYTERDYIEVVNTFIQRYTKSETPNEPPLIIPLVSSSETRYMYRDQFIQNFITKIDTLAYNIKKGFEDQIFKQAAVFIESPFMKNSTLFSNYIEDIVHKQDEAMLLILNNSELLYQLLAYAEKNYKDKQKQVERFFYFRPNNGEPARRRDLNEIFFLDRDDFLKDARSHMPIAMKFSLFRKILQWFMGFGKKMGKAMDEGIAGQKYLSQATQGMFQKPPASQKKAEEQSAKQAAADLEKEANEKKAAELKKLNLKKQLELFRKEMAGNKDSAAAMAELEKKWNLTLNKDSREQNLKLVKEKIGIRIKFMKGVSVESIKQEINDIMKAEDIFKKVHDRDALRSYIALYFTEYFIQKLAKG